MLTKQIAAELNINEDLLQRYAAFQPIVENLRAELQRYNEAGISRDTHPAWLGNGQSAEVYAITVEGKQYACRFADIYAHADNLYKPFLEKIWTSFKPHVSGLAHMRGVQSFVQLQAVSFAERVTITNIMPGQTMKYWLENPTEMSQLDISEKQIQLLFEALELTLQNNISMDMKKPENIFYDPKTGFGFIDFMDFVPNFHRRESFENLVSKTLRALTLPLTQDAYPVLCTYFGGFIARCRSIYEIRYNNTLAGFWDDLQYRNQMRLNYGAGYDQEVPD